MTADLTDPTELGRYVVTRLWWRWMPGMLVDLYGLGKERHYGFILESEPDYSTDPPGPHVPVLWEADGRTRGPMSPDGCEKFDAWDHGAAVPVFTDSATLGCLLALAEELAGGPVELRAGEWPHMARLAIPNSRHHAAPTRALALVRLCDALAAT